MKNLSFQTSSFLLGFFLAFILFFLVQAKEPTQSFEQVGRYITIADDDEFLILDTVTGEFVITNRGLGGMRYFKGDFKAGLREARNR